MKLPPALVKAAAKFSQLAPRERVLILAAGLAIVFVAWDSMLMQPLDRKRNDLTTELTTLQESMGAAADAAETKNATDPLNVALARGKALQEQLRVVDGKLASESAGLIEPQLMAQVIHDVLSKQRGVTLVSLRNLPPVSLAQTGVPGSGARAGRGGVAGSSETQAGLPEASTSSGEPGVLAGPYIHPVELVVEGRYLDVLAYLRELEALPWRFYWRLLELQTTEYPVNRVRIELGTLSMEREWIGI